jgi:hypothetical protein
VVAEDVGLEEGGAMMQRRRRRQVTVAAAPTAPPGVTPGAVLELHAARADGGLRPGTNGRRQWTDLSGNGNHGALSGFAWTEASGWSADRLTFDGADDYVQLLELGAARAGGVFSHEAWFLGGATGAERTLTCEGSNISSTPYVGMLLTPDGYLRVQTRAYEVDVTTNLTGTVNLSDGVWHHAVATSDGTDARLYVDGALVAGPAQISVGSYERINSAALGALRRSTVISYFNGEIAAARVYPFALTPEQVAANYAAGPASNTVDGAVLDLRAALATGDGPQDNADAGTTTWYDTSGNGHHGTLSGFAGTTASRYEGSGVVDTEPPDPYRLTFDGVDDYVQLPELGAARAGGVFSHEAWFLGGATGAERFLTSEGNTDSSTSPYVGMLLTDPSGYLRVETRAYAVGSTTTLTGTVNLSDGVWHHAVATSDGTDARLYVDGALVAGPAQISVGSYERINSAALGARRRSTVGRYFNGKIAAARVYPFALTPEQVAANYAAGLQ